MNVDGGGRTMQGSVGAALLLTLIAARFFDVSPTCRRVSLPEKSWEDFRPGAWVTYRSVAGNDVKEYTLKLDEVRGEKVLLECETPTRISYQVVDQSRAIGKRLARKHETITVAGRTLECVYEEHEDTSTGEALVRKGWFSPKVPGLIVKLEWSGYPEGWHRGMEILDYGK
jgi:hypothetical protein